MYQVTKLSDTTADGQLPFFAIYWQTINSRMNPLQKHGVHFAII